MRNFQRIAQGIDILPLLHSVRLQSNLWNQYTVRTSHPRSAHRVVDDIVLRYSKFDTGDDFIEKVCCSIDAVTYPAWSKLPFAQTVIFAVMARVQGVHLGRCMITRVAPGIAIPLHTDRIAEAEEIFPDKIPPALYYERYHVVLQSAPGSIFKCGEETVAMAPGEVWWFNNQIPHEVMNNSVEDRIHLIADIRTATDDYVPK